MSTFIYIHIYLYVYISHGMFPSMRLNRGTTASPDIVYRKGREKERVPTPQGHSITQLGRGVGGRGSSTHSYTYITPWRPPHDIIHIYSIQRERERETEGSIQREFEYRTREERTGVLFYGQVQVDCTYIFDGYIHMYIVYSIYIYIYPSDIRVYTHVHAFCESPTARWLAQ